MAVTESTVGAIEKSALTASADAKMYLKKSYERPQLKVYGNVATLTEAVGMGSRNDGRRNKTH